MFVHIIPDAYFLQHLLFNLQKRNMLNPFYLHVTDLYCTYVKLRSFVGTETYHQMLAKGLAHSFGAKLLILDITDLSRKVSYKSYLNLETPL